MNGSYGTLPYFLGAGTVPCTSALRLFCIANVNGLPGPPNIGSQPLPVYLFITSNLYTPGKGFDTDEPCIAEGSASDNPRLGPGRVYHSLAIDVRKPSLAALFPNTSFIRDLDDNFIAANVSALFAVPTMIRMALRDAQNVTKTDINTYFWTGVNTSGPSSIFAPAGPNCGDFTLSGSNYFARVGALEYGLDATLFLCNQSARFLCAVNLLPYPSPTYSNVKPFYFFGLPNSYTPPFNPLQLCSNAGSQSPNPRLRSGATFYSLALLGGDCSAPTARPLLTNPISTISPILTFANPVFDLDDHLLAPNLYTLLTRLPMAPAVATSDCATKMDITTVAWTGFFIPDGSITSLNCNNWTVGQDTQTAILGTLEHGFYSASGFCNSSYGIFCLALATQAMTLPQPLCKLTVSSPTPPPTLCDSVEANSLVVSSCVTAAPSPGVVLIGPAVDLDLGNSTGAAVQFTLPYNTTLRRIYEAGIGLCNVPIVQCQWQDPVTLAWLNSGCTVTHDEVPLGAGVQGVTCSCSHLTVFSVALLALKNQVPLCQAVSGDYILLFFVRCVVCGCVLSDCAVSTCFSALRLCWPRSDRPTSPHRFCLSFSNFVYCV